MKPYLFLFVATLIYVAPPVVAQTSSETSPASIATENIEVAKRYLALAGIEVPSSIETSQIPELEKIFEKWMSRSPAVQPGDDVLRVANPERIPNPDMKRLVDYLHPRTGARAARSLQFVEQQQELPSTIFAQVAGSSTGPTTLLNPQHYLASHALTVKFGDLFFSSSDLAAIYKSVGVLLPDDAPALSIKDCDIAKEKSMVKCLARARLKDKVSRALTGLTLNAGASQRNRNIQGVLFTSQFPDIDYTIRGQLDFDPTALFVTAANWGDAISILNSTHSIGTQQNLLPNERARLAQLLNGLPGDCIFDPILQQTGKQAFQMAGNFAQSCLNALAGRQGFLEKTLAVLVPTFQFKKESQFDFIKQSGSVFVPAAFPEPSLNTFSFTFDLRRFVPSTKDRTDALNAIASIYNRKKAPADATVKDQQAQVLKDYIQLAISPADATNFKKLENDITPFILQCQTSIAKGKACNP